ncbi:hypothetical protein NOGI109294_15645 [Nocardiopsis gilva]|uniref:hypothetical protein n=1 Tax=Nocardiopsis gilva TaxID=280236 RepID=UPI001E5E8FC3|nr:hypothetical protein [Nocardiopsis gilva]
MNEEKGVQDPMLWLLRRHYAGTWTIRRTAHLWIAVATNPDTDRAPTVMHDDVEKFVRELENPPPRVGRRISLLSTSWSAERLDQIGDGAYRDDTPPIT